MKIIHNDVQEGRVLRYHFHEFHVLIFVFAVLGKNQHGNG